MSARKAAAKPEVEEFLAKFQEQFAGKVDLAPASAVRTCDDLRRPTGITSLDTKLGGGWPAGRLSIISGLPGLGKDFLVNMTIAQIQRNYGDDARICIASFGAEHDAMFAQQCGVAFPLPESMIARLEQERGEPFSEDQRDVLTHQVGHIYIPILDYNDPEIAKNPAGWLADVVLKVVKTGMFQLVVLNELGSQTSKERTTRDIKGDDKRQVGETARFFDDVMARYCLYMKQSTRDSVNETTLLMLSQIRTAGIGGYHTYNESVGGNHLKHVKSIELMLSSGGPITAMDEVVGKTVKWKVVKGKHGIHDGDTGEYGFRNGQGVDLVEDTVSTAIKMDVVNKNPPYFSWGKLKVKGLKAFIASINQENLHEQLRAEVFRKAGLVYRWR